MDPIRFERRVKVDVQCLGWRNGAQHYLLRQDDLASVAFWYQSLPAPRRRRCLGRRCWKLSDSAAAPRA